LIVDVYDGLGQLLSASMTNINSYTWSADYTYYRDGNITSKAVNSDTTDFEYTGDRMTDIGDDELDWDLNGQLTESVTALLEYNWSGKLRSATAGADSISLKYDPLGNRVYKSSTVDSVTTNQRFIVDIAGKLPIILCVVDADDGSLERSYIYANAQPIGFYEGDYTDPAYIYLHDRLGSVRQVIDSYPNLQFAETVDNPFRFTGQWFDSEIAQYYLRARMYDPHLMRFTSIDPLFGRPFSPLTLHVYMYCLNDPLNRIDPDGENSTAAALVEPIMAGSSVHAAAIAVAAVGVAQGNWNILTYGIELEKTILPVMVLASYRPPLYSDDVPSIIRDYKNGVKNSYMGGGGPGWNLPKWIAIGTGIVILTAKADDAIRGIIDFYNFLYELGWEQSEEEPAFEQRSVP